MMKTSTPCLIALLAAGVHAQDAGERALTVAFRQAQTPKPDVAKQQRRSALALIEDVRWCIDDLKERIQRLEDETPRLGFDAPTNSSWGPPRIARVRRGGPAAEAGVEVGDVLTHVNGRLAKLDDPRISSLLNGTDPVTLTLQRAISGVVDATLRKRTLALTAEEVAIFRGSAQALSTGLDTISQAVLRSDISIPRLERLLQEWDAGYHELSERIERAEYVLTP